MGDFLWARDPCKGNVFAFDQGWYTLTVKGVPAATLHT